MNLSRAIAVTVDGTFIDARKPAPAPSAESLAEGLPAFLGVIFGLLGGPGVLLLDKLTADALGLVGVGKDVPALAAMRTAGFQVKEIWRWFHVKHAGTEISVGLLEHIDAEYFPMLAPRMTDTTAALATWHRLSGSPWFGSAGDSGNVLLKQVGNMRHEGRTIPPQWWTSAAKQPPGNPIEMPYLPSRWRREISGCSTAYGYDRVRAYLAAMTTTEVAGFHLAHETRVTTFNKRRAGWWRVDVAPWHLHHLMPDPAGYGPALDDGSRWLTTPRLTLLDDLEREGVHGGFQIHEAWTAPAQANVLRPYAAKLRTMYDHGHEIRDETERTLIHEAVKDVYRQQYALWQSSTSSVQRRDWSAAVTAMSAVTVWRACWKAGWQSEGPNGPWPLWIDNDAVYYPGPDDAAKVVEPHGFQLADKLGGWRPMPPRNVSRETGRPVSRSTEEANA